MTMPYDGRGRVAPAYDDSALPPEEFEAEYVDRLMRMWIDHMPQVGPPPDCTTEEARRFHATYLKGLSYFAWRFPSWLLAVASNCPHQDVRRELINDCVDEEVGDVDADGACHIDVLYEEAEVCGLSREEIVSAKPSPLILTSILAFENLCRAFGWYAGFAATAALEISHSQAAVDARGRILGEDQAEAYAQSLGGQSFHERLGFPEGALKFFALHSYKDRFHGGGELKLLVKYGNTRQLQEEAIWATEASVQVMGVLSREMTRLSLESIGRVPEERNLTQAVGVL